MLTFHSLELPSLERFLQRHKADFMLRAASDLDILLRQILQKAFEFVPSESGSILLDDPTKKSAVRENNHLFFVAAFGPVGRELLGKQISGKLGIAGHVYQSGNPYISRDVTKDPMFFRQFDQTMGYNTRSIVCVPVFIEKDVCGVIELINRLNGEPFSEHDLNLLQIFAGYTSVTLQNALDARRGRELAKKDDLTGLYNDRWFHVHLTETLTAADLSGSECVLIFLDLDHFKSINDTYGHLTGSQVLREMGTLLTQAVDRSDATIARYGGDEFVIVMSNASLREGVDAAERIRKAVEGGKFVTREYGFGLKPLNLENILTASVGVAHHKPVNNPKGNLKKDDLLRRADAAMYQAKALGKNRVVVSQER
ncbi:MAG TPA: sensor domain-containing diguanylate cyclase [Acidobacteriota bacterium]